MADTLNVVITVFLLFIAGIFVWLAFSPFEMLGWWAGWFDDKIFWEFPPEEEIGFTSGKLSYIVFFSGVGRATGETLSYRERDFLRRLAEANPQAHVIDDIFPYAVNNQSLTQHPLLAGPWRLALRSKAGGVPLAGYFINIRNIMQMLISADKRYGPLFNQGVAEVIVNGLMRHGYTLASNAPVFLIGYSGAAQMAVGASGHLKRWLKSPVYVISLGGVFGSDPSLLQIDKLYHLVGTRDAVEPWWVIAPGRWSLFATSEWNRAMRQGRIAIRDMGPMRHTGSGGYLDAKKQLPDGRDYVDATVEVITEIVHENEAPPQGDPSAKEDSATVKEVPALVVSGEAR